VEEPELKETEEGPDMPKSVMLTRRVKARTREPLVPVIVRLYDPAGRPAPHVGYSLAEPPGGTNTVEVFVNVVNQHAKAVDEGFATRPT
jgi:hypothetical protein